MGGAKKGASASVMVVKTASWRHKMNMNTNKVTVRNMLAVMALLVTANAQALPTDLAVCPEDREAAGGPLAIVCPAAGPYVIINSLKEGEVDFKYGWHNAEKMDPPPCAYWIGLYDHSVPAYVWSTEVTTTPTPPKLLKGRGSEDSPTGGDYSLIAGHEYSVNFFVRKQCAPLKVLNSAEIELFFEGP
jgi:hypothetical protein